MKTDSSKKLKRVTSSTNVAQLNKLVEAVYAYWIQKRSKLKKPLLRKFWPITATNDSSPHLGTSPAFVSFNSPSFPLLMNEQQSFVRERRRDTSYAKSAATTETLLTSSSR